MALHAHGQGFKAFQNHPRIERAKCGARVAMKRQDLFFKQRFVTKNRATKRAPLPIEIFGGGVDNHIRPEREGF